MMVMIIKINSNTSSEKPEARLWCVHMKKRNLKFGLK